MKLVRIYPITLWQSRDSKVNKNPYLDRGSPILSCLGTEGTMIAKQLLWHLMGAAAAVGGSLVEGYLHPLPVSKGAGLPIGLLKSTRLFYWHILEDLHVGQQGPTRNWQWRPSQIPPVLHSSRPLPPSPSSLPTQKELTAMYSRKGTKHFVQFCVVYHCLSPVSL